MPARTSARRGAGRRLGAVERRRLIVEEATRFFSEHGFGGGTPALARRLGITQPLLYRYFPTKDDLIAHVYEHAFPSRTFYPRWQALLADPSRPIRERLIEFYCEYVEALLNPTFLRLALWARLSRTALDDRYTDMLVRVLFPLAIRGLRAAYGARRRGAPTADEIEMMQTLHGAIYHLAIRRWISTRSPMADVRRLVTLKIDLFLGGAAVAMSRDGRSNEALRNPFDKPKDFE